jgi:transcriptional regulator with XRE-family HTH domain
VVGAALRDARERQDLTQERVGELAGLHRNYVGSVERGERNVSIEALERWLAALRLTWKELGQRIDSGRNSRSSGP